MSIEVTCPNGHSFKVKDKYAGKQGLCPLCDDRVVVAVPAILSEKGLSEDVILGIIGPAPPPPVADDSASVLDDDVESESVFDDDVGDDTSATMSLVGTSAIRHQRECPNCSRTMPYWFAKCPGCNTYLEENQG